MSDYLQPDFYRFNRDSLDLVNWIKNRIKLSQTILDLGAGCGVIGLELSLFYQPQFVSFVELQEDFRSSLENNIKKFLPDVIKSDINITSFSSFHSQQNFDLIACNPPYYFANSGQTSKDPRRAFARTFLMDDWAQLIACIERHLSKEGKAFVVVKSDVKIIKKINEALTLNKLSWHLEEVKDLAFWELFRLYVD